MAIVKKHVKWVACKNTGDWCSLKRVNLSNVTTAGVYLIWKPGGRYVRVGQGNIKDRLLVHRDDPNITHNGDLRVTWVNIPAREMDGVEAYLGQVCNPIVGDRFPDATPIPVNLPGE